MEHSRLEFISIWAEEFKHRIPEEHQGDGHYNSTGDMEQGRRNHPLPTQLQRNHPTITKTLVQIIWYKSKLHNHINTVKQGKCYTWLKIHKELLSSRKYIFLCAIYIPPSESPYYSEDTLSTLEEETSHFQAQGNVLICGDLNARTGLQPDFTDTQGIKYINNKLTVINNTFSHIHRNNHDHTVNKNGKDLLQLCRSLGLYIINGSLRGDTLGRFTFCSPLGNSTVDYMITDIDPSSLRSFTC